MSIGTTESTPRATKPHACQVCGKRIEVRERYVRIKGQYEREWQNWGAHTICLDIHSACGEVEVQRLCWRELVEMTTTPAQLVAFLARFPPTIDDGPAVAAAQAAYLGCQHPISTPESPLGEKGPTDADYRLQG